MNECLRVWLRSAALLSALPFCNRRPPTSTSTAADRRPHDSMRRETPRGENNTSHYIRLLLHNMPTIAERMAALKAASEAGESKGRACQRERCIPCIHRRYISSIFHSTSCAICSLRILFFFLFLSPFSLPPFLPFPLSFFLFSSAQMPLVVATQPDPDRLLLQEGRKYPEN